MGSRSSTWHRSRCAAGSAGPRPRVAEKGPRSGGREGPGQGGRGLRQDELRRGRGTILGDVPRGCGKAWRPRNVSSIGRACVNVRRIGAGEHARLEECEEDGGCDALRLLVHQTGYPAPGGGSAVRVGHRAQHHALPRLLVHRDVLRLRGGKEGDGPECACGGGSPLLERRVSMCVCVWRGWGVVGVGVGRWGRGAAPWLASGTESYGRRHSTEQGKTGCVWRQAVLRDISYGLFSSG